MVDRIYDFGTVSVGAGDEVVVGDGTLWMSNAKQYDTLTVVGFGPVKIMEVTDDTHLAISPWPYSAVTAHDYLIVQDGIDQFSAPSIARAVVELVEDLDADGFYIFVKSTETAPNPRRGDEGQYARQPSTGKEWYKEGGVWTYLGVTAPLAPATLDVQQDFRISSDITPAQITSNPNDYNPTGLSTATVLRLSSDASRTITGLAGGADGRLLVLRNVGSFDIAMTDESGLSTAANRFALGGFGGLLRPSGAALLMYDTTLSRWAHVAGAIRSRTVLPGNLSIYVRTDGDDANSGLANTAGGALRTGQAAWDKIYKTLDLNGYAVGVQFGDGTYAGVNANGVVPGQFYASQIVFIGNASNRSAVVISTTSASCFNVGEDLGGSAKIQIQNLKMQTTTSGSGIRALNGGTDVLFQNVEFGACATAHIEAHHSAYVKAVGNYYVSGGATLHAYVLSGSVVVTYFMGITFTNSPAFGIFAYVEGADLYCSSMTFTNGGTVTGQRFYRGRNAAIYMGSKDPSYLPGNAAGVAGAGELIKVTNYTTAGSFTWTKQDDTLFVEVEVQGGGGGGGGVGTANLLKAAAGGGQGGYARGRVDNAASTVSVTVGAGGAAGANTGGNGGAGGGSSFGSLVVTGGGGGGGGANSSGQTTPGVGGTATSGDSRVPGQSGFQGLSIAGACLFSGGGGGRGAGSSVTAGNGAGGAGTSGGGGGGAAGADATSNAGGGGGAGWVTVKEYA